MDTTDAIVLLAAGGFSLYFLLLIVCGLIVRKRVRMQEEEHRANLVRANELLRERGDRAYSGHYQRAKNHADQTHEWDTNLNGKE
jgi:hypothetical protein